MSVRRGVLYHVTHTDLVPKIRDGGLRVMQTSNWRKAGTGSRYGGGKVFAFTHKDDAVRWAGKMDWEFNHGTGTGKVSLVKIERHAGWQKDTADPLSHLGAKGDWLKRTDSVPKEHVLDHEPVTTDMIRGMVARDQGGEQPRDERGRFVSK